MDFWLPDSNSWLTKCIFYDLRKAERVPNSQWVRCGTRGNSSWFNYWGSDGFDQSGHSYWVASVGPSTLISMKEIKRTHFCCSDHILHLIRIVPLVSGAGLVLQWRQMVGHAGTSSNTSVGASVRPLWYGFACYWLPHFCWDLHIGLGNDYPLIHCFR